MNSLDLFNRPSFFNNQSIDTTLPKDLLIEIAKKFDLKTFAKLSLSIKSFKVLSTHHSILKVLLSKKSGNIPNTENAKLVFLQYVNIVKNDLKKLHCQGLSFTVNELVKLNGLPIPIFKGLFYNGDPHDFPNVSSKISVGLLASEGKSFSYEPFYQYLIDHANKDIKSINFNGAGLSFSIGEKCSNLQKLKKLKISPNCLLFISQSTTTYLSLIDSSPYCAFSTAFNVNLSLPKITSLDLTFITLVGWDVQRLASVMPNLATLSIRNTCTNGYNKDPWVSSLAKLTNLKTLILENIFLEYPNENWKETIFNIHKLKIIYDRSLSLDRIFEAKFPLLKTLEVDLNNVTRNCNTVDLRNVPSSVEEMLFIGNRNGNPLGYKDIPEKLPSLKRMLLWNSENLWPKNKKVTVIK